MIENQKGKHGNRELGYREGKGRNITIKGSIGRGEGYREYL